MGIKQKGFTIVELLIVIVVIAILAAITIVAFNGIQQRAKNSAIQADLSYVQAHRLVILLVAQSQLHHAASTSSPISPPGTRPAASHITQQQMNSHSLPQAPVRPRPHWSALMRQHQPC